MRSDYWCWFPGFASWGNHMKNWPILKRKGQIDCFCCGQNRMSVTRGTCRFLCRHGDDFQREWVMASSDQFRRVSVEKRGHKQVCVVPPVRWKVNAQSSGGLRLWWDGSSINCWALTLTALGCHGVGMWRGVMAGRRPSSLLLLL